MKLFKTALAGALGAALFLSACRRDDVLFVEPNVPTDATPQTLLTTLEVSTMNSYEGELTRTASILVQHSAGVSNQSLELQVYSLQEGQFENQWGQIYQSLNTGKELIDRFGSINVHYRGITKVLMVMNWGLATDLWGDIPYSEALQVNTILYPKYDRQQDVLAGILTTLDEAVADLNATGTTGPVVSDADVIFGGDLASWSRTAHTLKARYLNRYSNKSSQYQPQAILNELALGISDNAQNCLAIHGDLTQEQNQFFDFLNERPNYIQAHETLVNALKANAGDERLFYYFDSTGFGGTVVGAPRDLNTENTNFSNWGVYLAGSGATPFPLVTYMESKFIEAEVKARAADASGASDALNDAIVASAEFSTEDEYDGQDIATYTGANTTVQAVMTEKWKAMFGQVEAYNDYRRTGFPALTPNANGRIAVIPQRYLTPRNERVGNPNAPQPALTDKVWWATP